MNSEALCGIQRLLPSFLVSHDKNITAGSFIFLLLPAPLYLKWFTEFGHLNRGDMLTSEQHRCHNEKKKFQRRV